MSESTCQSVDKLNVNHTYSDTSNYWAPLSAILDKDEEEEYKEEGTSCIEQSYAAIDAQAMQASGETMIIDSSATSHFATKTINLPLMGEPSTKRVYLPDGSSITGTQRAVLPNSDLPSAAKTVDVLPNLKKLLFSVGKVADEGFTTVFHPRNQGVTIHKEGTITIKTTKPAEIQGWRAETGCGSSIRTKEPTQQRN